MDGYGSRSGADRKSAYPGRDHPAQICRMANYMATKVSGISIPPAVLKRMEGVPKEKAASEGIKICLETIQELRQIKGVHGIHIMAIDWEERVPEIVRAAGLHPRPQV